MQLDHYFAVHTSWLDIILHTHKLHYLADLAFSCGGEDLIEKSGRNATYTSKYAVVDFVETLSIPVEELLLKCLRRACFFSLLADECTDISAIEELSKVFHWVEEESLLSTLWKSCH